MTKDKKEFTVEKMSPLQSMLTFGTAGNVEQGRLLSKGWFKKSLEGKTCSIPHQFKTYGLEKSTDRIDGYKALLQSEATAIADSTSSCGSTTYAIVAMRSGVRVSVA